MRQICWRETLRHADKPNQKWVTDVTEFSLFGDKLYLSPILDLYSSDLVSYTISDRPVLSMVTSMLEGRFLDRAKKIGADSFWYKDSPSGDLVGVIDGTLAGKHFWPDSVPTVRLGKTLSCELSDREMETLRLLCEGKTNAEIAEKLNVAESSVRTYINRMLEKTGYTNRNRLMIAAVGKRMVVPGCWSEEHKEN